jgi:hypothetical protein
MIQQALRRVRRASRSFSERRRASARGPYLLDMEVVSVLSGLTLRRKLKPITAEKVRSDHCAFLKIRRTLIGTSGCLISPDQRDRGK